MENKIDEKYNTKVEIPISVILETIFNSDNRDVETLSRWALKYGFVDLIEKDGKKYYQLQDDYTKQSFYVWLSKEERKQYDYEDYLIDELEQKENIIKEIRKYIEENLFKDDNDCGCWWYGFDYYKEAKKELLEILDKEDINV